MIGSIDELVSIIDQSQERCATFLGTKVLYCQFGDELIEYETKDNLLEDVINSKKFKIEQANMQTIITHISQKMEKKWQKILKKR